MLINLVRLIYRLLTAGFRKGSHVTRYFMYCHLSKHYYEARRKDMKVLSISHSENLARILGFDDFQIIDASYPECNILNLPFEDNQFDAVVIDQVLAHVEGNPIEAIDESFRVLKPGGLAVHTSCFFNPTNLAPKDFWRFSPDAMRFLAVKHGTVLDYGGWGNIFVLIFFALGLRYAPIPHASWHPAHWVATFNDYRFPVITWVVAKKS